MSESSPEPGRRLGGPGFGVVETARGAIGRHRMLAGGERVVVAVSGGPDSTCLLDVLARLSASLELSLVVAHVDHGLAEASGTVAARVSSSAAESGYDVHLMRIADLEGPNLHARARALRYGFFDRIAEQVGAERIATGHTLDDRVETTVARLIHGAGADGLAGLRAVEGTRIRPLIECRRSETRAYCDELGLAYHDDPANDDERFERPAVRRRLVAAIEERWGDGGVRAIATSAERLGEDASALASLAARLYDEVATAEGDDVRFSLEEFAAVPRALQRRLLQTAVGRVRDRSGGIDGALDAVAGADRGRGRRFAVASGIEIDIGSDALRVHRNPEKESG